MGMRLYFEACIWCVTGGVLSVALSSMQPHHDLAAVACFIVEFYAAYVAWRVHP